MNKSSKKIKFYWLALLISLLIVPSISVASTIYQYEDISGNITLGGSVSGFDGSITFSDDKYPSDGFVVTFASDLTFTLNGKLGGVDYTNLIGDYTVTIHYDPIGKKYGASIDVLSAPGLTGDVIFFFKKESSTSTNAIVTDGAGYFTPVPIPAAGWLLGSGLIGMVGLRRKFRK